MTKPRLGKVRALFYVFQQVMTGREMRVHQNFDTPSYSGIKCTGLKTAGSGDRYFTSLTRRTAQPNMRDDWESRLKTLVEELPSKRNKVAV